MLLQPELRNKLKRTAYFNVMKIRRKKKKRKKSLGVTLNGKRRKKRRRNVLYTRYIKT